MVNWRTYRITRKSVSSSYILFSLDNYVSYNNGSYRYKHIYCSNFSPFYNWRENEFIEIDNDATRYMDSGYYFGSTDEVRLTCHYGCGHSHGEYDALKERSDSLERERNDLINDRDEWRRKYEEIKTQLSNELSAEKLRNVNEMASEKLRQKDRDLLLGGENTKLKEQLNSAKIQETSLKKQIEDGKSELSKQIKDGKDELNLVRVEKDNQLILVKNELTQKGDELKGLEKAMAELRVDHEKEKTEKELQISEKENEIKEKEEKIKKKESEMKKLREKLGLSQEEFLKEKIRSKQEKLDTFAGVSKIDLGQVQDLCDYYEEVIRSNFNYNRDNIKNAERNVSKVKQELSRSEVQMEKIQKLCRKCEKLASLRSQLDQILGQQYEARQEVPINN